MTLTVGQFLRNFKGDVITIPLDAEHLRAKLDGAKDVEIKKPSFRERTEPFAALIYVKKEGRTKGYYGAIIIYGPNYELTEEENTQDFIDRHAPTSTVKGVRNYLVDGKKGYLRINPVLAIYTINDPDMSGVHPFPQGNGWGLRSKVDTGEYLKESRFVTEMTVKNGQYVDRNGPFVGMLDKTLTLKIDYRPASGGPSQDQLRQALHLEY